MQAPPDVWAPLRPLLPPQQILPTPEATETLARRLAPLLPPQTILALHGDIGAGKTTFVRGLARAYGITADVNSPSFTLYYIHQGTRTLVHLDAYRLPPNSHPEDLLLEEFCIPPYCLAIEWPQKLPSLLEPAQTLHLHLSITPDGSRLLAAEFPLPPASI